MAWSMYMEFWPEVRDQAISLEPSGIIWRSSDRG